MRENLTVYPKLLIKNVRESLQLNCVYRGHHYLSIKLIWYKNGTLLSHEDEASKRVISLDYKQNYTHFSLLKFSSSLMQDSGVYTCFAVHKNKKTLHDQLNVVINKSKFIF